MRTTKWLLLICLCINAQAGIAQFWEHTFGGFGSDDARSVIEHAGKYYILGSTGSFGNGSSDMYLVVLEPNGLINSTYTYGGIGVEQGRSIVNGNGILLTGLTNSFGEGGYDGYLVNINDDGDIIWEISVGSADWDFLHDAVYVGDGWVCVGTTYDSGASINGDAWVVKVDLNGEVIWQEYLGNEFEDEAFSVSLVDDRLLIAGALGIGPDAQRPHCWVLSSEGALIDSVTLVEAGVGEARSIRMIANGDVIITGYLDELADNRLLIISQLNSLGEPIWFRTHGLFDQHGNDLVEREGGGFAIVGFTAGFGAGGQDTYIMLTDAEGYFESGFTFGLEGDDVGHAIIRTENGFVFVGSTTSYGPGISAMHVVRTNSMVSTEGAPVVEIHDPVSIHDLFYPKSFSIHPNPITPGATLNFTIPQTTPISSITLTDLRGRIINQESCNSCSTYQIPQIASGIYQLIFILQDGSRIAQSILVD